MRITHRVTAITRDCAKLCGWKNPEQAIGYTDYDIPLKVAQYADELIKLDKLAMTSSKKLKTLIDITHHGLLKGMLMMSALDKKSME